MKTTIEMAREAADDEWGLFREFMPEIHRLAELIRADEREACAKVCDTLAVHPEYVSEVTKLAALAIRSRSNT